MTGVLASCEWSSGESLLSRLSREKRRCQSFGVEPRRARAEQWRRRHGLGHAERPCLRFGRLTLEYEEQQLGDAEREVPTWSSPCHRLDCYDPGPHSPFLRGTLPANEETPTPLHDLSAERGNFDTTKMILSPGALHGGGKLRTGEAIGRLGRSSAADLQSQRYRHAADLQTCAPLYSHSPRHPASESSDRGNCIFSRTACMLRAPLC